MRQAGSRYVALTIGQVCFLRLSLSFTFGVGNTLQSVLLVYIHFIVLKGARAVESMSFKGDTVPPNLSHPFCEPCA